MLGDPDAAEAAGLGAVHLPERLLDHLPVGERLRRGKQLKDPDVHGWSHARSFRACIVPRYQDSIPTVKGAVLTPSRSGNTDRRNMEWSTRRSASAAGAVRWRSSGYRPGSAWRSGS